MTGYRDCDCSSGHDCPRSVSVYSWLLVGLTSFYFSFFLLFFFQCCFFDCLLLFRLRATNRKKKAKTWIQFPEELNMSEYVNGKNIQSQVMLVGFVSVVHVLACCFGV